METINEDASIPKKEEIPKDDNEYIKDVEVDTTDMVQIRITENGFEHAFWLDGYLKANLDHVIKDVTKRDFDCFLVIAGREGYGKSTLACQIARYCDPTYNINRCCFTAEQFERAVTYADKYQAIVFDETMGYLSSRGALSKFNRSLIKVMSEMRSKNLYVILCVTSFFELDKYPAIHRSTGLIVIKERSKFGSYNYINKKNLYLFGKRFYSYKVPPNFIGKFGKQFPMDKVEYEKKKQWSIAQWGKKKPKEEVLMDRIVQLERILLQKHCYSYQDVANITGEDEETIRNVVGVHLAKLSEQNYNNILPMVVKKKKKPKEVVDIQPIVEKKENKTNGLNGIQPIVGTNNDKEPIKRTEAVQDQEELSLE